MPELPEVETIKRQLARKIIGKKIKKRRIVGLRRRAKILIIDFDNGSSLLFHLKMTGQLIFNGKVSKHTRKVFYFNDGSRLLFNDLRKFGWWKIVRKTDKIEENFGPEALTISLKTLKVALIERPNSKIKTLLLNQKFIAGIGNIYSDEILFASKVRPERLVRTLKDKEIKQIHQNIRKILKKAIKHRGSSIIKVLDKGKKKAKFFSAGHYIDACGESGLFAKYHKVYQKAGQKCVLCNSIIKKIKLAGRSSCFCPHCQS